MENSVATGVDVGLDDGIVPSCRDRTEPTGAAETTGNFNSG